MSLANYLEQVKARAANSTPGPWYEDGPEVRHDYDPYTEEADCSVKICDVPRISAELDAGAKDRKFIAHSRTDIPKLLAIIEVQRKALMKIAGRDYRGNRPQDAVDAFHALAECDRLVEPRAES